MLSKKQLFKALDVYFVTTEFTTKGLNATGLSNETYGRDSMIYVSANSEWQRIKLEEFLIKRGFKVHTNYHPGGTRAEVQVSYFKGWHWDE